MLKDVVQVQPRGSHRLWLRFEGGDEGEVDLGSRLTFTGVFVPLSAPDYFAEVRVDPELGTIVWPNGAHGSTSDGHSSPNSVLWGDHTRVVDRRGTVASYPPATSNTRRCFRLTPRKQLWNVRLHTMPTTWKLTKNVRLIGAAPSQPLTAND